MEADVGQLNWWETQTTEPAIPKVRAASSPPLAHIAAIPQHANVCSTAASWPAAPVAFAGGSGGLVPCGPGVVTWAAGIVARWPARGLQPLGYDSAGAGRTHLVPDVRPPLQFRTEVAADPGVATWAAEWPRDGRLRPFPAAIRQGTTLLRSDLHQDNGDVIVRLLALKMRSYSLVQGFDDFSRGLFPMPQIT